jgi:hypothetical protein
MASRWVTLSVGLAVMCAFGARTAHAQDEAAANGEALPGPSDEKPEPKRSALNAALGYGGFGRSSPHPGFGGKGFMYSLAGEYQIPASPKLAITIGLRLTGGFMSYDDGSEGTYKSTLVLPALTGGFAFR